MRLVAMRSAGLGRSELRTPGPGGSLVNISAP